MKNIYPSLKRLFISLVLAIALIFAGLGLMSLPRGADAATNTLYTERPAYYIADSVPLFTEEYLEEIGYGSLLTYELKYGESLTAIASEIYSGDCYIDSGSVVVLEINNPASPDKIKELIYFLKSNGCIVVFISIFDYTDIFEDENDEYCPYIFYWNTRVLNFIDNVVKNILETTNADNDDNDEKVLLNSAIFIDSSLLSSSFIDVTIMDDTYYQFFNNQEFLQYCPLVRLFIERLCDEMDLPLNYNYLTNLFDENNVKVYVYNNCNGLFTDIFSYEEPTTLNWDEIFETNAFEYIFTFGLWRFEPEVINMASFADTHFGSECVIYAYERDPLANSPNGIIDYTDSELREMYTPLDEEALNTLLQSIIDLIY